VRLHERVCWPGAVAILFATILGGCSAPGPGTPESSSPRNDSPTIALASGANAGCQSSPVRGCHEIEVGGRPYRYYFAPPTSGGNRALLVDLGGPGLSLAGVLPQDYETQFRKDLGTLAQDRALLLLEEPWVTAPGDPACSDSSARFYSWLRRNWRAVGAAHPPDMHCPWGKGRYGWSPGTYRGVLGAVMQRHGILNIHMAALSFGAVRYSYVDDIVGSAVLARPAAVPGTSIDSVLHARRDRIWQSILAMCAECQRVDVEQRLSATIMKYAKNSTPVPLRSVPLIDFDVASAFVAQGIGGAGAASSLAWHSSSGEFDVGAAADLSDALWLRVGEEAVSPGFVAYVDEYCQAYPGAAERPAVDPVHSVLSAPTVLCGETPSVKKEPRPVACTVAGSADASAPPAFAQTWRVREDGARVVSPDARHWFAGVEQCGRRG
jgi:hypothetical protein